jgi:ankyrin repeat protein
VLKNINQASRACAHRLLQCLTVAVRPLRLEELAEVLAFDFDESSGGIPKLNADWPREDQEHAVLSTCSSLITVVRDGSWRVVQFSHFSVKEFLTSDRLAAAVGDISFHHIALSPAHTILAQASLGVLLRLDDSTREIAVQRFPLAEYAAEHWVHHAQFDNVSTRIKDGIEKLFGADKPHFARRIRIHDMDDITWGLADGEVLPKRLAAAPVYYAALCGFPDVVEKLLSKHPEHVNARGGAFGTALHAAATRNHLSVAQTLLRHGADVNSLGQWERTPLHIASVWGHLEIARWLLDHGADVNAKQDDHWTPLHEAANNGHVGLVRALLQHHGVDIDARNEIGNTPLHAASSNGEALIVRLLLDRGAGVEARGKDRSTPLHVASCYGKMEVVRLLIDRGADVDAEDDEGRTAYQIVLQEGHDEIAHLLMGHVVENKT